MPHQILLAHPVGQNILVNNGVLSIIMDLVLQEVDTKLSVSVDFAMSFNYPEVRHNSPVWKNPPLTVQDSKVPLLQRSSQFCDKPIRFIKIDSLPYHIISKIYLEKKNVRRNYEIYFAT